LRLKYLGDRKAAGKNILFRILYSFGNGIRTENKIPDYPGPAHGYKVKQSVSFLK
jgi:hypothetical protein